MNITINYGTGNSISRSDFPQGTTIAQVLADPRVKGALGYGSNVEAHLDGIPQPGTNTVQDGDVLSIHDKACNKAADLSVTIQYGTGNSITKSFPAGTTVEQVLTSPAVRGGLGYGANVEGHLDGIPMPGTASLRSGDVLSVHDKACNKASSPAA